MHFLRVNVTFYDAVNVTHDVVKTAYIFPYTAKFISKKRSCHEQRLSIYMYIINREYVHSVAVYKRYLTRFGEMITFLPRLQNYQFSQPR